MNHGIEGVNGLYRRVQTLKRSLKKLLLTNQYLSGKLAQSRRNKILVVTHLSIIKAIHALPVPVVDLDGSCETKFGKDAVFWRGPNEF